MEDNALKEFEVLTTLRAFDRVADYLLEASEASNSSMIAQVLGYHAAAIRTLPCKVEGWDGLP